MATRIDTNRTIGQVAAEHPGTRRVFEKFGLDYCCGGDRRLAEAVREEDVDEKELRAALREAVRRGPPEEMGQDVHWPEAPLTELADHIQRTHHAFMKENLPRLEHLVGKVLLAHEENHGPMLARLQEVFRGLREEIEMHLQKEEEVLFPYIRRLQEYSEEPEGPPPRIHCLTVRNPVTQMRREHEEVAEALHRFRELTDDYALPGDACATFAELYETLQALEEDLHQHIHLENNILFPRAIKLEEQILDLPVGELP